MMLAAHCMQGWEQKEVQELFSSLVLFFSFMIGRDSGFGSFEGDSLLAITGCQQAKDLCSSISVTQNMTVSDAYKVLLFSYV